MLVTILGSSGSLAGPDNPASGYLVGTAAGEPDIVLDMGPGTLANLQRLGAPEDVHVGFSHLHPDHCLDFPSLLVWRRFHPSRPSPRRHQVWGPSYAPEFFGRISSDRQPGGVDDLSDTVEMRTWDPDQTVRLSGLELSVAPARHPVESYLIRVDDPAVGRAIVYSGDTAWTPELPALAADADLLFCEATWGTREEGNPPAMHLTAAEAGRAAQEAGVGALVLVHLPPWADKEGSRAAAAREFGGPVLLGLPGQVHDPAAHPAPGARR